jgi:hypothetical protein
MLQERNHGKEANGESRRAASFETCRVFTRVASFAASGYSTTRENQENTRKHLRRHQIEKRTVQPREQEARKANVQSASMVLVITFRISVRPSGTEKV